MKLAMIAGVALVACASIASAKPHTAPDTSFLQISGGSACPAETTPVVTGSNVIFRNTNNGNLTEDARCWQTPPAATSQVDVLILGPCVVCRFGP